MTKHKDEIWAVLGRYFARSISGKDQKILDQWLAEDEENRQKLEFMEETLKSGGDGNDESFFRHLNVDEDWGLIASHIRRERSREQLKDARHVLQKRKRQHTFPVLLKVAALLLVASTSGYFAWHVGFEPGLADERSELAFIKEVSTDRGERVNFTLGDGTRVSLNVDSKLLISHNFGEDQRKVKLEGEAFFDVTEDPDRPFLIEAGGTVTEVLGTSFGVRSYESDTKIQVVVKNGTVALRKIDEESERAVPTTVSGQTVLLRAGEMGVFTKRDQRLSSGTAGNPDDYFGWMQNRLIFREAPLWEIIAILERWYDVTITSELSDKEMNESRITLNMRKGHIRDVLDLIGISSGIRYDIVEDDHIVIR